MAQFVVDEVGGCATLVSMPTTSDDVIWLLDRISLFWADPILAGGWGVDALLGEQSRDHRDLDVLVHHGAVPNVVENVMNEGFSVTTDWLPVRIELSDIGNDRHLDLHPIFDDGRGGFWQHGLDGARFEYPVDLIVRGVVGGRAVRCLSATKQLALHDGYELRSIDHHDREILLRLAMSGRRTGSSSTRLDD